MRIANAVRGNPDLYSHRRLVKAAEAKGHRIDIINTTQCYANITSDRPQVLYRGARALRLRRRDSAHWGLDYLLRAGGAAGSSK